MGRCSGQDCQNARLLVGGYFLTGLAFLLCPASTRAKANLLVTQKHALSLIRPRKRGDGKAEKVTMIKSGQTVHRTCSLLA